MRPIFVALALAAVVALGACADRTPPPPPAPADAGVTAAPPPKVSAKRAVCDQLLALGIDAHPTDVLPVAGNAVAVGLETGTGLLYTTREWAAGRVTLALAYSVRLDTLEECLTVP